MPNLTNRLMPFLYPSSVSALFDTNIPRSIQRTSIPPTSIFTAPVQINKKKRKGRASAMLTQGRASAMLTQPSLGITRLLGG